MYLNTFAKISHESTVITACKFVELPEANYYLMWKSCLQVGENDTTKLPKKVVKVDMVYILYWYLVSAKGITFHVHVHVFAFSGQINT